MIQATHGVTIAQQRAWDDGGIEEVAIEVHWITEPGWLTLQADTPTLLMMAAEIGGRCEFRVDPDCPWTANISDQALWRWSSPVLRS